MTGTVMGSPSRITLALSRWIDEVAVAVLAGIEHVRAAPQARFTEQKNGLFVPEETQPPRFSDRLAASFRLGPDAQEDADADRMRAIVKDARVEILLQPDRFLFRPLELPARAGEFLEGIVRAQIDRLTPWSAPNALFGWSSPVETSGGRVMITVAATGRTLITPLTDMLSDLGAASICLRVPSPDPNGEPITVSEQQTRATRETHRARQVLVGILAGLGGLAALSILALIIVGSDLEARQSEVTSRIDTIRSSLQGLRDPSSERVVALQRRKQETPSSVLVLEAISGTLPDHTYLTELRIQDGKVQIIGMTNDAPSLIELLERSPQFREASFFAPTTRSLAKPGDTFHIEAKIQPLRSVQP
jgi:general secretion pathway protein L